MWISVNNRLPEATPATILKAASESDNVLFFINDGWGSMVTGFYCYKSNRWYTYDGSEYFVSTEITHWQPLPAPPKEG